VNRGRPTGRIRRSRIATSTTRLGRVPVPAPWEVSRAGQTRRQRGELPLVSGQRNRPQPGDRGAVGWVWACRVGSGRVGGGDAKSRRAAGGRCRGDHSRSAGWRAGCGNDHFPIERVSSTGSGTSSHMNATRSSPFRSRRPGLRPVHPNDVGHASIDTYRRVPARRSYLCRHRLVVQHCCLALAHLAAALTYNAGFAGVVEDRPQHLNGRHRRTLAFRRCRYAAHLRTAGSG